MLARILPAVMVTLLCGSYAQAGLMLGGLDDSDLVASQADPSAMAGWSVSQPEGDGGPSGYLHGAESGLAAVFPPSLGNGGLNAALSCSVSLPTDAGLRWRISVGNSALPPLPLLDGLLEPS